MIQGRVAAAGLKGACKGKPVIRPAMLQAPFPQVSASKAPLGKGPNILGKGSGSPAPGGFAQRSSAAGSSEIGRLLGSADLGNFEQGIKRLGVESAADLKYVTQQDLQGMNMTIIQRRKFDELVSSGGSAKSSGGGGGRDRSRSKGRRDRDTRGGDKRGDRRDEPRDRRDSGKGDGKASGKGKDSKGDSGKGKGKEPAKTAAPWGAARPGVPNATVIPRTVEAPKAPWAAGPTSAQGARWPPPTLPGGAVAKASVNVAPAPTRLGAPKAPAGPPPNSMMRAGSAQPLRPLPSGDDVVKEAERRLRENGARKFYWEEVAKLKRDFKLSERVELALKLLEPAKLNALLRESGDLPRMLTHAPDKDKLIRNLVARKDAQVDHLVTQLEAKEKQTQAAPSSKGSGGGKGDSKGKGRRDRSRSPRGGKKGKW